MKSSIPKLFEKKAEEDLLFLTKFIGVSLFVGALLLFYIARLTKKLKERNNLILKSDELTQIVIADYHKTLEEEKNELTALKRAYLGSSSVI